MEMSAAMRAFMFLFTLAHVPLSKCHCNQVAVAKCFTDLLNNWAWDLWKIKEDIAKLDADSCERFENIKVRHLTLFMYS